MIEITKENFEVEVLKSDVPVLVDFNATWCPPCRMLHPILEEVAKEADGKYKVASVDVDNNQELAMKYQVSGIPTVIVFKDGEVAQRSVGLAPKDRILAMLGQ